MVKVRLLSEESGSVLVLASLSLIFLLSIVGLAIDVGHLRQVKRTVQNAADAAALAAAIQVRICGTNSPNCSSMQSAARNALAENGLSATNTLVNCAGAPQAGVTLTINNPVCAVATDPNRGKMNYVEAVVSQQVPMMFARLVGMKNVTVSARAEAARGVGGPCIYALDPSGPAIIVVAGVLVKANCGVVDESASSNALTCVVGAFIYAPRISVSGGSDSLLCLASSTPRLHVPPPTPRDPLAYLPPPPHANDACGSSTHSPYTGSPNAVNLALLGNTVFNPGVYCGGISLTANLLSSITFNPGVYILRDAPGLLNIPQGGLHLTLSALTSVTGNGVMFYNEGPVGTFTVVEPVTGGSLLSLANVSLSAPTSGEYGGVLMYQAHGVTASGTFLASLVGSSNLQGAIYLPDAAVGYGVSALSSSYNILVAKDIYLTVAVGSTFGNDYSTLESGTPLNGDNVRLVQ
jgi:Flp pilus assembly protein TadG